jgi:hypothetical protein
VSSGDRKTSAGQSFVQRTLQQARTLCNHEDDLSRVIAGLDLPCDTLRDGYDCQPSHGYDFAAMLRVFLYKHAGNYSDTELATRLGSWPYLQIRFSLDDTPTQQTLSYTRRNRFTDALRKQLAEAGQCIRDEACKHDVIRDSPNTDEQSESDDQSDAAELTEGTIRETVRAAGEHVFSAFDTGRAGNATYSDDCILAMQSYLSLANCGTAQGTDRFARMSHRDETPHSDTHLRAIKKLGTPDGRQATLSEFQHTGRHERTEPWAQVFGEIQDGFSAATENIIDAIRDTKPFREPVIAAIDITDTVFYPSPWEADGENEVREDYPAPVNGLKEQGTRGYQFATLTIVGEANPIILAVEPVKANSQWEDDAATRTPKAEVVDRLLSEAQKHVDLHLVLADRGFDGHAVLDTIDQHGLEYLIPKRKYRADLEGISKVEAHPTSDVGVEPDVELRVDGRCHEVNFLYVPSTTDDGEYAVFLTNREDVAPADVRGLCNRYSRRWVIENEYKQIKQFLPTMASTDYRIRAFNFVFSCLLYNVWRLVDHLLKLEVDEPVDDQPIVTAGETIELLACFLVPYG